MPHGEAITIRDLLGMRGGVYDYSADPEFAEQLQPAEPTSEWGRGDVLRVIAARPDAARRPRQHGNYSNSEYYLLGLVLEQVTGKPARQVLNDLAGDHGLRETFYPAIHRFRCLPPVGTPTLETFPSMSPNARLRLFTVRPERWCPRSRTWHRMRRCSAEVSC